MSMTLKTPNDIDRAVAFVATAAGRHSASDSLSFADSTDAVDDFMDRFGHDFGLTRAQALERLLGFTFTATVAGDLRDLGRWGYRAFNPDPSAYDLGDAEIRWRDFLAEFHGRRQPSGGFQVFRTASRFAYEVRYRRNRRERFIWVSRTRWRHAAVKVGREWFEALLPDRVGRIDVATAIAADKTPLNRGACTVSFEIAQIQKARRLNGGLFLRPRCFRGLPYWAPDYRQA